MYMFNNIWVCWLILRFNIDNCDNNVKFKLNYLCISMYIVLLGLVFNMIRNIIYNITLYIFFIRKIW